MNLPIQASRNAGWLQHKELPQIIGSILALATIGHIAVFAFRMVATVETLQVQYIPDDAYYYLALARNFVRYKQWTFDSGVSVTLQYKTSCQIT